MANERFDVINPGTSKIIEFDSHSVRRHSTGKFCTPNTGVETPSRYLRPRQHSCHDYCKYGLHQLLETKERCPKSMSKRKKPEQKHGNPIGKGEISLFTKERTISSRQVLSQARIPKLKPTLSSPTSMRECLIGEGDSNSRRIQEMEDLSMKEFGDSSNRRKGQIMISKDTRGSSEKSYYLNGVSSPIDKKTVRRLKLDQVQSEEQALKRDKKSKTRKSVNGSIEDKSSKHGHNVFRTTQLPRSSMNQIPRRREGRSLPTSNKNEIQGAHRGTRVTRSRRSSLTSSSASSVVSSDQHGNHLPTCNKNGMQGAQRGTHVSRSRRSSLSSLSTTSAASSDQHRELDTGDQISYSGKEISHRPKRGGKIPMEDKHDPNQKLSFRRGKVIDIESKDSSPMRLKFRRRWVPDDNQNDSIGRKNDGGGENSATESEATTVVSEVQDVEEKDCDDMIEKGPSVALLVSPLTEENLRFIRSRNNAYSSPPSWPSSPKKKGLRGIMENRVCLSDTCSLASWSSQSDDDATLDHGDNDNEVQVPNFKKEHEKWRRMGKTFSEANIVEVSRKMSFRRGTVVELQSEDCTPRRLKFRRRVLLRDSQDAKADSRESHRKDQDVLNQPNKGAKDMRNLFNNVIEETVSKLVKTKKNKVLALVGAFETVISLQDGKPSVTATAS